MFNDLLAEMRRNRITIKAMAEDLSSNYKGLQRRLHGKGEFTGSEMRNITAYLNKKAAPARHYTMDDLFGRTG